MGLSEGKRKTRLVGSAVTNNSAWTNDASLPGQRLLSSMGWSQGQGLGTSSQGTAVPIAMAFKMDNKGIGARRFEKEARANGVADAWVGGGGQLGDLFERLNKASGSASPLVVVPEDEANTLKKSKKSKKDKEEKREKRSRKGKEKEEVPEAEIEAEDAKVEEAVEKVASTLPNRMAHRARFLRAKRMVGTDVASVNEILGIASPAGPSSPAPLEAPVPVVPVTMSSKDDSVKDQVSDREEREAKRKRKREERSEEKPAVDDKKARKEAKRLAKDAKREEKKRRKESKVAETASPSAEIEIKTVADPSTDPSFAAGGGMKVSSLSVHEYLQNQLMRRKAALLRRRREEEASAEASLWNRAATVCT